MTEPPEGRLTLSVSTFINPSSSFFIVKAKVVLPLCKIPHLLYPLSSLPCIRQNFTNVRNSLVEVPQISGRRNLSENSELLQLWLCCGQRADNVVCLPVSQEAGAVICAWLYWRTKLPYISKTSRTLVPSDSVTPVPSVTSNGNCPDVAESEFRSAPTVLISTMGGSNQSLPTCLLSPCSLLSTHFTSSLRRRGRDVRISIKANYCMCTLFHSDTLWTVSKFVFCQIISFYSLDVGIRIYPHIGSKMLIILIYCCYCSDTSGLS